MMSWFLSQTRGPANAPRHPLHRGARVGGVIAVTSALLVSAACSSSGGKTSDAATTPPNNTASADASSSSSPAPSAPAVKTISQGKLAVAVQSDQFPFDFIKDGKEVGFSIDLMNEIAKRLGLQPAYTTVSLDGILAGVPAKQYDIAAVGLSIKPERQKVMAFSEPYYYGYYGIIAKKSANLSADTDFAGKVIALVSGSAQDTYAKQHYPKAQLKRYEAQPQAIAALEGGQVDAFFVGGPDTINYLQQYSDLALVASIQTSTPNGFPMSLDNPSLVAGVNAQLNAMMADGTYTTIYKQWFVGEPLPPKLVSEHPVLAGGAASPSSAG
jgi:ABC-type amino acid transport substrate-binding protein